MMMLLAMNVAAGVIIWGTLIGGTWLLIKSIQTLVHVLQVNGQVASTATTGAS